MAKNFLASSFLFLFIYIFIALGVFYKLDWVYNLDKSVISYIQSFITDSRTALIIILTDFAGTISIIILTALTVIFLIYKRMYILSLWFGMTILLGPGIFVYIMKKIVDRDRPGILRLAHVTSQSFPSGHSTAATVFLGLLGIFIILTVHTKWIKILSGVIAFSLITFIMFTRVYLGVHFPTDVLAGFSFGIAVVSLSIALYKLYLDKVKQALFRRNIEDQSPSI